MPKPGWVWRHVILGTLNSWLPGDPRGFRSRDHHIHSSGDYRNPPPEDEHAGLHEYAKNHSGPPVVIPISLRPQLAKELATTLTEQQSQILIVSVSAMHAHLLAELPWPWPETRKIVGEAKRLASKAVREQMPGRIWGRGATSRVCEDQTYQRQVYNYILKHKDQGAGLWTYKDRDEPSA
ncbi:MAG: hypothetical protein IT440_09830 [Phycisphaeraceae bacterium]|nr:hypothetical protein [Phycisphaeraceae bacterium]